MNSFVHVATEETNRIMAEAMGLIRARDEALAAGECALCNNKIKGLESFRNRKSFSEWGLSGLCQNCQDEIFGTD